MELFETTVTSQELFETPVTSQEFLMTSNKFINSKNHSMNQSKNHNTTSRDPSHKQTIELSCPVQITKMQFCLISTL